MGQHQLDSVRDGVPSEFPVGFCGLEQLLGRIKEIAHEVGEDVDDGLPFWEFSVHLILHCGGWFCGRDPQLPPDILSALCGGGDAVGLAPSHLQEFVLLLEIYPVLNATEIAVVIIIRYGGDFCGPQIRSV